ncbi:MAG TPA: hypothetical protein VK147_07265 [Candidatus Didemnitutus sp.]|nr:hypothetical protein [Candidatus Didemnitutus sp.]
MTGSVPKVIVLGFLIMTASVLCHTSSRAQTTTGDTKVASPLFGWYAEFGGTGLSTFSIHGELTLFRFNRNKPDITWAHSVRASVGLSVFDPYFLPVSLKLLLLDSRHHIETGVGLSFLLKDRQRNDFYPATSPVGFVILGYRYEPQDGGGQIRVFMSPWYEFETQSVEFWFGLSFGVGVSLD